MFDADLSVYILQFFLALLCGISVKIVDYLDDDLKSKNPIKFVLAIIYGILLGYLIGNSSFSLVFLAALIAQALARKIDTRAHQLGFLVAVLSLLVFSFPTLDWSLFVLFVVAAFLDEIEFVGALNVFTRYRLFLIIATVISTAVTSKIDYLIAIVLFDLGYVGINSILSKKYKNKKTTAGTRRQVGWDVGHKTVRMHKYTKRQRE